MAVFAFSVAPLGAGESVADSVAEAVRIVRESGLPNRTTSMFTEIEGDLRPGRTGELTGKVERVEERLAAESEDTGHA
jgi:uncharacterized protein YqgV (UPF0045/DUF77 family)